MKRYVTGQAVEAGFYLNTRTWEMAAIGPKGGTLQGPAETWCVRVPALLMLLVAPALGALYVIFLPAAGFAMLFRHLGGKTVQGVRTVGHGLTALTMPGLRLGAAYLHRRRGTKPEPPAEESSDRRNT